MLHCALLPDLFQEVYSLHRDAPGREDTCRTCVEAQKGIVDFEAAYITAFKEVFPAVDLHGCNFHFAQALWRRVQQLPTIRRNYVGNPLYAVQIRMIAALAHVPEDKMQEYYELLVASPFFVSHREELADFLMYFEQTWLGWTTSEGEKRLPRYPLRLWGCHTMHQENLEREGGGSTTNIVKRSYESS